MKNNNRFWQLLLLICGFLFAGLKGFTADTKLHIATEKTYYTNAEKVQFQVFMINPPANINNSLLLSF